MIWCSVCSGWGEWLEPYKRMVECYNCKGTGVMTTTDRLITINEVHDDHAQEATKDRLWAEMNEEKSTPPEVQDLVHWILGPMSPTSNVLIDFETHNDAFNRVFERAERAIALLREREAAAQLNIKIATDTGIERCAQWLESNGQPGYAVEIRCLKSK